MPGKGGEKLELGRVAWVNTSRRASVRCWKQLRQTDASEHVRFRCLFWLCCFFGYFLGEKVLKYKVCFD